jgi:hypothetical protein
MFWENVYLIIVFHFLHLKSCSKRNLNLNDIFRTETVRFLQSSLYQLMLVKINNYFENIYILPIDTFLYKGQFN